jgi:hypothetical protein
MRLIDILKITSFDVDVIIYDTDNPDDDPLFEGGAHDVPWSLAEKELDVSCEDGTIFSCVRTNEHGVVLPYIIFYIKD